MTKSFWLPNQVRFQSYMPQVRMEAGTGAEGQGNTNPDPPKPDPAPSPNPSPQPTPAAPQTEAEKKFSQAELEEILKTRLEQDRKRREKDAETQRLKDQQEFQKLAEQHETRVKELEPQLQTVTEQHKALSDILEAQLKAGMKEWPKELTALVPATGDILERLAAFETARGLFDKFVGQSPNPASRHIPGAPAQAPRPADPNTDPVQREAQRLRQSGKYSSF